MTTATFCSNGFKSMYLGALKRNMPLGIFYAVLMTVFFPLMYIITLLTADRTPIPEMDFSELQNALDGYAGVYIEASTVLMMLICAIMPVVFGVIIFSYMYNKKSTDVYHALPLKRQGIFTANYFAGLTLLWAPIIISYIVILIAGAANSAALGVIYHAGRILVDMLVCLVCVSATYTITAMVAVLSGTGFDTVLYAFALCGMSPIILFFAKFTVNTLLMGFSGMWSLGFMSEMNMLSLSPFTLHAFLMMTRDSFFNSSYYWFNLGAICVWALITVALFFVANRLYTRRKSELAGCTTASSILSKIVQYALVFVSGTLFGMLLGDSFGSKAVYLLGVVIGGGIAYTAYEAVLARGFRTFPKAFVQMGISVGLTLAFVGVFLTGGLGYETYVPAVDEVQSVAINYNGRYGSRSFYALDAAAVVEYYENLTGNPMKLEGFDLSNSVVLSSPEGIQIVHDFHAASIGEQQAHKLSRRKDWDSLSYFRPSITYLLKNGTMVTRNYSESKAETVKKLGELEDLEEFYKQTNPAFLLEVGDLANIKVSDRLGRATFEALNDAQQAALLAALREDTKNQRLSDMTEEAYPTLGYIDLCIDETKPLTTKPMPSFRFSTMLITEGNKNTVKWLKENNIYDKMQVDESKLARAAVSLAENDDKFGNFDSDSSYFTLTPDRQMSKNSYMFDPENTFFLSVEDPAQVKKLFALCKNYGETQMGASAGCWVHFEYSGSDTGMRLYLAREDVPPELQAYFAEQALSEPDEENAQQVAYLSEQSSLS